MELVPRDPLVEISKVLRLEDILSLATSNNSISRLLLSPQTNKDLANYFAFPYNLSYQELKLYEKMSPIERLLEASKLGDERVVKKLLELYEFIEWDYIDAAKAASRNGRLSIVKTMLERGVPDYINLITPAIKGKHFETFKYLYGTKEYSIGSYNAMFLDASQSGNLEVVEFLIEDQGIESFKRSSIVEAFSFSAVNIETFNFFLSLGKMLDLKIPESLGDSIYTKDDYSYALAIAARAGNNEIIETLLDIGKNIFNFSDYTAAMNYAAEGGYIELFNKFLTLAQNSKGPHPMYEWNPKNLPYFNEALLKANSGGHIELAKHILKLKEKQRVK